MLTHLDCIEAPANLRLSTLTLTYLFVLVRGEYRRPFA